MWPFKKPPVIKNYSVSATLADFYDILRKREFTSAPAPFDLIKIDDDDLDIVISNVVVAQKIEGHYWSGLKLTDVGEAMRDEILQEMRRCVDADEKAVNTEIDSKVSVVREALQKFYSKEK